MCRRHIFKQPPSLTLCCLLSLRICTQTAKYHAVCDFRWQKAYIRKLKWRMMLREWWKWNWKDWNIFNNYLCCGTKGYEWHISSALKTHVQKENNRGRERERNTEEKTRERCEHKSHLQAYAPHHCTHHNRCNNDHRHQITLKIKIRK